MSLQMSSAQSAVRSVAVSGIDQLRFGHPKFSDRLAEDGVTLSLIHLDVALAVEAQGADVAKSADGISSFKVSAKRLARVSDEGARVSAPGDSDPVMRRLSDALAATEAAQGAHSAILADALRLAILTRKFSRQTDGRRAESGSVAGIGDECTGRPARSLQKWRLKRVMQYVDDNLGAKITLHGLAAVAGLSRMHFAAQFRAAVGMRPHEYLLKRRIERAEELLRQGDIPLVDVALTVGFQTQAHFTTVFKRFTGETPHQWRSAYLAQFVPLPRVGERLT
jgi:AraC-like DNA-binding protein